MANTLPLRIPVADPAARKRRRMLSPLVVDARRLARLLCCGIRTVRTWDAAGRLPIPLKIGGRTLWNLSEIRDWLDSGAPDRETWAAIRAARK